MFELSQAVKAVARVKHEENYVKRLIGRGGDSTHSSSSGRVQVRSNIGWVYAVEKGCRVLTFTNIGYLPRFLCTFL